MTRRSVVLIAWYFLCFTNYGRVTILGPFDTQGECERMRDAIQTNLALTRYCWFTESRP